MKWIGVLVISAHAFTLMQKREADAQLDENDKLSIVMLNTHDAILDAIWNEDIEGFPDKFRDENLKELFFFIKKKISSLS